MTVAAPPEASSPAPTSLRVVESHTAPVTPLSCTSTLPSPRTTEAVGVALTVRDGERDDVGVTERVTVIDLLGVTVMVPVALSDALGVTLVVTERVTVRVAATERDGDTDGVRVVLALRDGEREVDGDMDTLRVVEGVVDGEGVSDGSPSASARSARRPPSPPPPFMGVSEKEAEGLAEADTVPEALSEAEAEAEAEPEADMDGEAEDDSVEVGLGDIDQEAVDEAEGLALAEEDGEGEGGSRPSAPTAQKMPRRPKERWLLPRWNRSPSLLAVLDAPVAPLGARGSASATYSSPLKYVEARMPFTAVK